MKVFYTYAEKERQRPRDRHRDMERKRDIDRLWLNFSKHQAYCPVFTKHFSATYFLTYCVRKMACKSIGIFIIQYIQCIKNMFCLSTIHVLLTQPIYDH